MWWRRSMAKMLKDRRRRCRAPTTDTGTWRQGPSDPRGVFVLIGVPFFRGKGRQSVHHPRRHPSSPLIPVMHDASVCLKLTQKRNPPLPPGPVVQMCHVPRAHSKRRNGRMILVCPFVRADRCRTLEEEDEERTTNVLR